MIGRILLGILLVLLFLLAVLLAMTLQVRASYRQGEAALWVRYGPLKLQLYPPKPKKEKKERKKKKDSSTEEKPKEAPKKKLSISTEQILYTLETLPPVLVRALGRVRRGIRIEPMKVHLLLAGEDPAGTALLYGRAQAALAAGMLALRKAVCIRGEDIRLFLDFRQMRPDCITDIGISIRCWTGAGIALRAGASLVKWFFGFRKLAPPPKEKPAEEKQDSGAA